MRWTASHARLTILCLLLWVGFALRLHNLTIPNMSIDETWSFLNSYYLAYPSGYTAEQILMPEPNNALHLVLLSLNLRFVPGAFGARWLSVMIGVLTIALAARVAFRLFGRRAAIIAPLILVFAYAPVTFAQIARPYALATMLAVLSLLFWLEQRPRLNMLASALVPLAHIGAMPVVVVQDLITLWQVWRRQPVHKIDWLVRRIPTYAMFFLIVYLTYQRRPVHVISSGQIAPSPADLLNYSLNVISSGFPALTAGTLLFLLGAVLPLVLLAVTRSRQLPKNLSVPILWIATTYGLLIAGAVLSDGPIKWLHISHVAIAIVLLMAGILVQAPRAVAAGVVCATCIAGAIGLVKFYDQPDLYWSNTLAEMDRLRQGDEVIYLQQSTVLWAFQVNDPGASYVQLFPAEAERPPRYLYAEIAGWDPPAPAECAPEPLWSNSSGLRLLACAHG